MSDVAVSRLRTELHLLFILRPGLKGSALKMAEPWPPIVRQCTRAVRGAPLQGPRLGRRSRAGPTAGRVHDRSERGATDYGRVNDGPGRRAAK
jgi:hypothetical protein